MELQIKPLSSKIGNEIPFPSYATPGSAAMDLHACIDEPIELLPNSRALIPTGIAIALPDEHYVAFLFARSGLAVKHGICLSNSVGVIDSDYRGELSVGLWNSSSVPFTIQPGDRIAQLAVMPVIQPAIVVTEELSETSRGEGGFGSTGR